MSKQSGITLVEVLVTMVILAIGLLGLVGLQARVQVLQIESYQRAQAIMLLEDMAGRVANNRVGAAEYVTADPVDAAVGTGGCPTDLSTRSKADLAGWCNALQGAAEQQGGTSVGAMVGGRGCVEDLGSGAFRVTVAWQGLTPLTPPPDSVICGQGNYDGGADSTCTGDRCRRAVTTVVQIADLT